jgi:hypothetical protein
MNNKAWREFAERLQEEDKDRDLGITYDSKDPKRNLINEDAEYVLVEQLDADEDNFTLEIKFSGSLEDCEHVIFRALEFGYIGAENLGIVEAGPFLERAVKVTLN